MEESRKGQIAILVVKSILREKGIRLSSNYRRELGNEAKNIGISFEEFLEFAEPLIRELVDETFAKPKKSAPLDEIGSDKVWEKIRQKKNSQK